jgi:TatD DNase family protein
MARLADSHCHLDFNTFDDDRGGVIAAAEQAGLVAIVNPGTSLETSRAAVTLAETYPMVYAAVGVHPHDASTFSRTTSAELRQLASHPKVVAIGEIGLDYYRNYSPRDAQRRAFAAQLELAGELKLPVIIHNRDAAQETMGVLRDWARGGACRRGVLHSYSAGLEWLERVLDLDFYIGVSGPVTFAKATTLQRVVQRTPLERLLVETDAPFLTPEPYRGRRNEPAYVQYVTNKVAALKELRPEQVAEQTTRTLARLANIGKTFEETDISGTSRR